MEIENFNHNNLKNQEIASLDKNPKGLEPVIVGIPRDDAAVDAVLAGAGTGDGPGKLDLGAIGELVHEANEGPTSLLLLLPIVERVDEILELRATELAGTDAEDEAYGVHEVRFSGAVGANDGGEVGEGTDHLEAFVRLEILHLQAVDFPRRE